MARIDQCFQTPKPASMPRGCNRPTPDGGHPEIIATKQPFLEWSNLTPNCYSGRDTGSAGCCLHTRIFEGGKRDLECDLQNCNSVCMPPRGQPRCDLARHGTTPRSSNVDLLGRQCCLLSRSGHLATRMGASGGLATDYRGPCRVLLWSPIATTAALFSCPNLCVAGREASVAGQNLSLNTLKSSPVSGRSRSAIRAAMNGVRQMVKAKKTPTR
jgi:hypothetical protein